MNKQELYDYIDSLTCDIEFEYAGVHGAICPTSRRDIDVCFGDFDKKYSGIEEVMSDKVYFGKSLNEISDDLDIL